MTREAKKTSSTPDLQQQLLELESSSRTRDLAKWVHAFEFHQIPEATVTHTKKMILKTVTGMLVGSRTETGKKINQYVMDAGGKPVSGVAGAGIRTSAENAALANAIFAHASELEDNELPQLTSDFWLFPGLLSVADECFSSGADVIAGAVVMWEVASRFNRASNGCLYPTRNFCPPSWFCPMGVAAGSVKLLNGTAEEIENAINLTSSFAGGTGHGGKDGHFIESGHTCQMGIIAAKMARLGATAMFGVMELPGRALLSIIEDQEADLNWINGGLGESPLLINNACIKKYGFCTYIHTSVDALTTLLKENNLNGSDIVSVEAVLATFPFRYVGSNPAPDTIQTALFSTHYCLGEVLVCGGIRSDSFTNPESLKDVDRLEAMTKVNVVSNEELDPQSRRSTVTVTLKDGEKLVRSFDEWIGSPQHPITLEAVADICLPFLQKATDRSSAKRIIDICTNLENEKDVFELMDIVTHARVGHRNSGS